MRHADKDYLLVHMRQCLKGSAYGPSFSKEHETKTLLRNAIEVLIPMQIRLHTIVWSETIALETNKDFWLSLPQRPLYDAFLKSLLLTISLECMIS